jgi:hypothetical protein
VPTFLKKGHRLFELMCVNDLEGIVAKRLKDAYHPRVRWQKIKNSSYSQNDGRRELFDQISLALAGKAGSRRIMWPDEARQRFARPKPDIGGTMPKADAINNTARPAVTGCFLNSMRESAARRGIDSTQAPLERRATCLDKPNQPSSSRMAFGPTDRVTARSSHVYWLMASR